MTGQAKPLVDRCRAIELLVLDVDGVLTGGDITYGDSGTEMKAFHVRDGSGLKVWQGTGKKVAIISGRASRTVARRAEELGIALVFQGAGDKLAAYRLMLEATGLKPRQVACMGDDLPDLPLLGNCGLALAVADACPEVLADAQYITSQPGGRGAVREAIELILSCQGEWQPLVDSLRMQKLS